MAKNALGKSVSKPRSFVNMVYIVTKGLSCAILDYRCSEVVYTILSFHAKNTPGQPIWLAHVY